MTLTFTKEEQKYLRIADRGDYRLVCDEGAPKRIKDSLAVKFEQQKRWISGGAGKDGKRDGNH